MTDTSKSAGVRRRDFLKILGATGAATAAVGCSSDRVEKLIPYLVHPDDTVPGVSNYYATTCRECSASCGVIAETRDGRAIKLEGNPAHPLNRGALCAVGQAALQGLYNPDRFRGPMMRQGTELVSTTWERALATFSQRLGELRTGGRARDAVFINRHETGSFPTFLDEWLAALGMPPHVSYDVLAHSAVVEANRQTYGVAWPRLDFGAARLIVSIGADFLDTWGAIVPQQLDYADARAKIQGAPRLVYIGARRSLTGLNADQWIAARPGSELAIARALLGAVGGTGGTSLEQAAAESGVDAETLERLARELATSKPSLALAGATTANATEVALAVNAINRAAGNVGATIRPAEPIAAFDGAASSAAVADLVRRMNAREVSLLMVRGSNPVFSLPQALGFAQAMRNVPFKVSFSSYPDETSALCDLVLPDHHPLESWGNAQPTPTVIALQQPTMDPVFNTRQTADVLLGVAKGNPSTAAAFTAPSFREWLIGRFPGGVQAFTAALTTGLTKGSLPRTPAMARAPAPQLPPAPPPLESTAGDFYFMIYPSPTLGDGSGANKPWLQELPDPVTKVCWQSWIEVHPQTAERLGVEHGDVLTVEGPGGRVSAPAYIYLGIRPDTVAMAFGQGHTAYGRYAEGTGVNPLSIVPAAFDPRSGAFAWTATRVRVAKAGEFLPLVTTEGSARQHGRGIAQAVLVSDLGTRAADRRDPGARTADEIAPGGAEGSDTDHRGAEHGAPGTQERPPGEVQEHAGEEEGHEFPGDASHEFLPGLRAPTAEDAQGALGVGKEGNEEGMYDPDHWSNMAKQRWAMTIDLARCTGCSACVVACYAENNIPTVGAKYQTAHTPGLENRPGGNILRSREMTWIRVERYYEPQEHTGADIADFETRFVPMLCQHCGAAPCEPVCPVYATYHSPDGLNVQVYNRCVGTRYCSNNCPYKVRYFNWFGYGEPSRPQYAWPEPLNWQLNPDVTVRGKGVMEKCTFCVQRIREAEHRARLENRPVRPDEFTVACAQACPSRAITFGDAAKPDWSVTRLLNDERTYHVFDELNTYTAVVYLKKVNHPAPPSPAGA